MKTFIPKEIDFQRKAYLVDANQKIVGRLATRIATILIGKSKPVFAPDQLCGDQVVVINAKAVVITGNKAEQKIYKHYSGYPGGLKTYTYEELMAKKPEEIIKRAVFRMLPKNKLGREMKRRLRVYAGAEHKQKAQQLIPLKV